jgi:hypothetical protein
VGASVTLRTLDYTPTSANTIYVSKSGDDANLGTSTEHVLTIARAMERCTSTGIINVLICDSETYTEYVEFTSNGIHNIYADIGCAPTIIPSYNGSWFKYEQLYTNNDVVNTHTLIIPLNNGNAVFIHRLGSDNKTYFKILNNVGGLVKSDTLLSNTAYERVYAGCVLSNGNWACITGYQSGASTVGYLHIYTTGGVQVLGRTAITPEVINYANLIPLDGKFVVAWGGASSTSKTGFKILDNSGSELVVSGTVSNAWTQNFVGCKISNTRWLRFATLISGGVYSSYLYIHDDAGNTITTRKLIDATSSTYIAPLNISMLPNGNIGMVYMHLGQGTYYYATYFVQLSTDDLSDASSRVTLCDENNSMVANTDPQQPNIIILNNGNVIVHYISASNTVSYRLYDDEMNEIIGHTNLSSRNVFTYNILLNGNIIAYVYDGANYYIRVYGDFTAPGIKVSTPAKINGVKITTNNSPLFSHLIQSTDDIDILYTTLYDAVSGQTTPTKAIETLGALSFKNSVINNVDVGIDATGNDIEIEDSQFSRILLGYAIDIDGVGAIINHCDYNRNYGGIKLANNDGSEVIKNSIFSAQSLYSIYAETTVTVNNSILSGSTHNTSIGLSVILANPHYINNGSITPSAENLHLKSRILGYRYDSPAISLADDERNAGAYDTSTGAVSQSWTSTEVDKGQFKVTIEPVGDVKVDYKDGSTATYRDSYKEVLEITWTALSNADLALLKELYYCSNPQVRIYPDPITYPNSYNTYTLIYDKVTVSPKHNKLSRTGVSDFSLTFERAYNEGA